MAKRADLEPLIVRAWLEQRPAGQRGEGEILAFYGQLQREQPHLLAFKSAADKYQVFKTILRHHIEY